MNRRTLISKLTWLLGLMGIPVSFLRASETTPTGYKKDGALCLNDVNRACAVEPFTWHGYELHWTGWKLSQSNCYLQAHWIAYSLKKTNDGLPVQVYKAECPGEEAQRKFFDPGCIPHGNTLTLDHYRRAQQETLHKLFKIIKEAS